MTEDFKGIQFRAELGTDRLKQIKSEISERIYRESRNDPVFDVPCDKSCKRKEVFTIGGEFPVEQRAIIIDFDEKSGIATCEGSECGKIQVKVNNLRDANTFEDLFRRYLKERVSDELGGGKPIERRTGEN